MLKKGIRILALEDAPFTREQTMALTVGVVARDTGVEGILAFDVRVDGDDATCKIIERVRTSRFNNQIKLIVLNGVSLAGMNIIDMPRVAKELRIPVIGITRTRPRRNLLLAALKKAQPREVKAKAALLAKISKSSVTERSGGFYIQCVGIPKEDAAKMVKQSISLLRLAHLVASGVTKGESKGRL